MHLMTFGTAAAVAGVAGTVVSVLNVYVPVGWRALVLKAFAVVILGASAAFWARRRQSRARLSESYVGTFIQDGSGWAEGVTFLLIIVVLLVRPQGMFGGRDHG